MRRILLLMVLCVLGCKSASPPPPPPQPGVRIDVPGVNIRVQDNGGVNVYDPTGRSGVPTIVVPGH